jgi:hypothetical protein
MPIVSGVNVKEIEIDLSKSFPVVMTRFSRDFPTLIDITATSESNVDIGRAIINDNNPDNNIIEVFNPETLLGKIVWLRIIIHHPTLKKYDLKVDIRQEEKVLHAFEIKGDLSGSDYTYEGFILKQGEG